MLQPTGRRGSDEDGAAEEEEGRWHLDEEEDGRRRRMRSRLAHDSAGEGCGTPGEEEKNTGEREGGGEN